MKDDSWKEYTNAIDGGVMKNGRALEGVHDTSHTHELHVEKVVLFVVEHF